MSDDDYEPPLREHGCACDDYSFLLQPIRISDLRSRLPGIAAGAASIARMKARVSEMVAASADFTRAFEAEWTHPEPPVEPEPARRRQRKPNISAMIRQAEKAGKEVSSVTADGVTLQFGRPDATNDTSSPWDSVYEAPKRSS